MLNSLSHDADPLRAALLHAPDRHLFASHDLDETRALVGRVMKPHRLDVSGRAQRLASRMHHAAFGEVALSRLSYGAAVEILPGPLEDFYLVQMPLAGSARIQSGRQQIDSTPELASVLGPTASTAMRWSADCDQIMVRIARPLVERTLAAHLGRAPAEALEFALGFRWRECTAWHALVGYLAELASRPVDFTGHRLLAAQVEQLVVATLLSMHAHNFSEARTAHHRPLLPRHVRKVRDYLEAHADEPVTPAQLAAVAGVSLRSLFSGFKTCCGVSPMQYLKALRLDRARADLQAGAPDQVADVAVRWGFGHLGRFSADYKARFGECPSETRRGA